tara:strand:- start:85 stop:690 length:606 start_codon:yes stop_codon:yes gene_type:complete
MKIIIINGPSGSGKTTLSNQILKKLNNGILLSTDNYYKTDFFSKFLSIWIDCYFEKKISFNYNLFKKDLNFIVENRKFDHFFIYDFKNKTSKRYLKKTNDIEFVIVEGIFANEFLCDLKSPRFLTIELKISKEICMNRVINRDVNERGKDKARAKRDFMKSWQYFYTKNKKMELLDNKSRIFFSNEKDMDFLIDRILKFKN